MTEYKLSMTGRLVACGACGLVALMVLLFALGVVAGQRMAAPVHVAAPPAPEQESTPDTPAVAP